MRAARRAALAAAALALAGCSLAPPYQRPAAPVTPAYKEVAGWQQAGTGVPPAGAWWQAFGDRTLDALEARIEGANPSLAAAAARYTQARELVRVARAQRSPQVSAEADGGRSRVSAGRPLSGGSAVSYSDVVAGASLSYELDLFGRVRNSIRQAEAEAQASGADLAGVRLGLQASLATDYFDMRGLDARIVLLQQTVAAYKRAFDLTDTRHSGGISSGLDVSRAQAQLSAAQSELDAVVAERAGLEHAVAVLVGESPSAFALPVAGGQTAPPVIAPGLPSVLLERRPDITAAERRVAEANFRIGVTRAALYPDITLGLSGGFEGGSGSFLSAANGFWALGPAMAVLSLIDGGARRAQVRVARAQFDEAAANYRQTVLTAFREVEDDLAQARQLVAQERDQLAAAQAAERTRDLALVRYRDGASDYLDVVTAQTAALDAERTLLDVRTRQLEIATDLFRALGGEVAGISAPVRATGDGRNG